MILDGMELEDLLCREGAGRVKGASLQFVMRRLRSETYEKKGLKLVFGWLIKGSNNAQ